MGGASQARSYTRARVSTEQESAQADEATAPAAAAPTEEPRLRRRPFGYSKRDVREALDRQSAALGAREAELAELRQDIAALWLAFAQHDRMIRRALGDEPAPAEADPAGSVSGSTEPAPTAAASAGAAAHAAAAKAAAADEDAAIGRQLSDLDDVLAAIELATQTLERTYAGEGTPSGSGAPAAADDAGADKPTG